MSQNFFDTRIEFLKGVGPQRAALLNKELSIFTYGDLIQHYPFRYEDRSRIYKIAELSEEMPYVQIKATVQSASLVGEGKSKRLVAICRDDSGEIELVWFKGANWVLQTLKKGIEYLIFGKPTLFNHKYNIAHPDFEAFTNNQEQSGYLQPVYNSTEILKRRFLDSKAISKIIKSLLEVAKSNINETLPDSLLQRYKFISKADALCNIHMPQDEHTLQKARVRLKFEELFFVQLKLLKMQTNRKVQFQGMVFNKVNLLTEFYNNHLPFDLTNAQKRVIKEIFADMKSAQQMNRLLQGDVGSGKTIVAFICMLIAIDNGTQACLMAPTEILADQHYQGLKVFADKLGVKIAKLTGSSKKKERTRLHEELQSGELNIIVGTHALLEDVVQFKNLGLCIIDEQHRFGVEQRSKLWHKNAGVPPHILVMTATPIPRTLAMTLYGDLDVSIIDELPAGRKPIQTVHRYEKHRLNVFGFIKQELAKGRQAYVVYPLIEESEKMDYKDLMDGYESICRAFPDVPVSIVHGKMKPVDKDFEMQRFVKGETKIMVATTVIEVGVNVPNASIMVIESAEKFGLSQLHQLRGRVGRGAEQSYCILMTDYKLSADSKVRLSTMERTNNGFEIADTDLKLRGPGDLMGTQQSGVLDLLISDLARDGKILQEARAVAQELINKDPKLELPEHEAIRKHIASLKKTAVNWSRIS
jgi:ATP-dependent DNA helicase RecG